MKVSVLNAAVFGAICIGLSSPVASQRLVSPAGDIYPSVPGMQTLATIEGNKREVNLFGRNPLLPLTAHTTEVRYEQVDGDITGRTHSGTTLKEMSWRRDGYLVLPEDLEAMPRVIKLHVRVGLGTYNDFGPQFGANFETASFVAGPVDVIGSSTVYRSFSLPDMTMAPFTVPAPFIVPFPFDRPFTIPIHPDANYDSLIWSLQAEDIVTGCYPLDAFEATNYMAPGAALGTGCIVGTNPNPMTLRVVGDMHPTVPEYKTLFDLDWGPPRAPVTLLIGFDPANVPVAGLCTNFFVQPHVAWPIGVTNDMGNFDRELKFRWDDDFEGQHLYFQELAPDAQQRFPIKWSLTNGVDLRLTPSSPKVKSIYAYGKNDPTGLGGVRYGTGVVTEFGYDVPQ